MFGILRTDGAAVDPSASEAMTRAMRHWNSDGSGVWSDGGIFLGHLMLRNTPESLNETNPCRDGDCTIVSDARLDNRDEILDALRDERDLSMQSPDSHLILRLYRRYGAACMDRLVGDFAFAIWDGQSGELFCARDQMGVKPFFYHRSEGLFVFASEQRGILAHPDVSDAPDSDFVHRLIAGIPPVPEATFHASVRHLLPGHFARVSAHGISSQRYWSLQRPERLLKGSPEELAAGFRDVLSRAVSDRLRSMHPVACELSGGLDSSAVTSLASRLIDDRGRIHTFSAVLPRDAIGAKPFPDEEEYADEVIRHSGITHSVKVSSSGSTGLFDAQDLELEVCAGVDIFSSFWLEPFRRIMSERGIRTSLSGFLGDELATHHGRDWYYEYLAEGRPMEFWKASAETRGMLPTLKGLAGRALPKRLKDALSSRHASKPDFGYLKKGYELSLTMNPPADLETRKQVGYKDRLIRNATNLYARQRMQSEALYGIRHRIEPRYPFADIRVLRYVLALPADSLGKARVERRLLRESLAGILPDRILRRTDKQVAAGVFHIGEERARAEGLRDWLKAMGGKPLHPMLDSLDLERVLRTLDPDDPANRWEGAFYPQLSFQMQCLMRLFAQA